MVMVFIGFSFIAVIASGSYIITQRFEEKEFMQHWTEKWEMTKAGWRMFETSPLIGLGYRGYYENYRRFNPNAHRDKYDAHNIYITALANYGLLGFLPFIAIFLYPLVKAIKILRSKTRNPNSQILNKMAIICATSLIPFMLSGWFAGGLFYSPLGMSLLYTNLSLFFAQLTIEKASETY